MTRVTTCKLNGVLDKLVLGLPAAEYALNLTLLYEDGQTCKWAREIFQRTERLLGPETVRGTWWKLDELSQPGVLAGAVSQAMRADLVVVAVRASEGLPLPFYFWVNSWLPHRLPGDSALVALLGAVRRPNGESGRLREYLRVVAHRGRMGFLFEER